MKTKVLPLLLIGGLAACSPQSAENAASPNASKTATNLDDINLNDTSEDPAYVTDGEEIAKKESAVVIGKAAPLAKMKTIDGQAIDLAKTYGKKPVYIKFWATWCVPCRQQMPGFEKTFETMGDKMEIIAINIGLSDDEASVRKFREKYGLKMPIVMDDGRLAKLFHLGVTPQHVLIGKDIRFAYLGHADNKALRDAIAHVIAGGGTAAMVSAAQVSEDRTYKQGELVQALPAVTLTGAKLSIGGARPGKLRAVQFFSSWCEWYLEKTRPQTAQACARTREQIEAISTQNPGVEWISVAGGPWATAQDLADYRKNHAINMPLVLDKSGALFRAFGIRDIPTIGLFDQNGRLVRLIGPGEKDLAGAIRAAQEKIATGGRA